jgi:hypothetical protein
MRIGCMIWRVDGVLDLYAQATCVQAFGFETVEFWTLPGQPQVPIYIEMGRVSTDGAVYVGFDGVFEYVPGGGGGV